MASVGSFADTGVAILICCASIRRRGRISDQAKSFASELENMVRRNPIGAIAGAVVVGVPIGLLARRS
jgi:ElaB/YqjD/DUF883 family membrane-anchored ribosome-binding protein